MKFNKYSWNLIFPLALVIFALPYQRRSTGEYFMPFYFKAMFFLLLIVPFLGSPHSRYYAQFVPLFGVALGCLVSGKLEVTRLADLKQNGAAVLIGFGQLMALSLAVLVGFLVYFV